MNNLGALRLIAAGMVIFGHSFVITGQPPPEWFGVPVHVLAVRVFFTISGYLIAASWLSDPSVTRFALRRALRIMPGLAAVVAGTVLVLGPSFTALPLGAYAGDVETRRYLWNALLAPYYLLPGVFQDGRPFTAVNGSLWSLPIEAAMYALLPLYAGRAAVIRWTVLPSVAVAALAAGYVFTVVRPEQVQPVVYWSSVPFALRFAGAFVLGALVRCWRLETWLSPQAGLLLLGALGLMPAGPLLGGAVLLVIPYLTLAFGLAESPLLAGIGQSPLLAGIGHRADISYGLYLWGCPAQQALVSLFGLGLGPFGLTAAALALAAPMAWVSWRWIERPCLALKPGRRAAVRDTQADAVATGVVTS